VAIAGNRLAYTYTLSVPLVFTNTTTVPNGITGW
jgi:PKD repeat protein